MMTRTIEGPYPGRIDHLYSGGSMSGKTDKFSFGADFGSPVPAEWFRLLMSKRPSVVIEPKGSPAVSRADRTESEAARAFMWEALGRRLAAGAIESPSSDDLRADLSAYRYAPRPVEWPHVRGRVNKRQLRKRLRRGWR
jgi:hypothetical protein